MKHTSLDIKLSLNKIAPDLGYARIVSSMDNSLRIITENGDEYPISKVWDTPVNSSTITDPSSITPNQWDKFIIPPNAVGDWTGHDNEIAQWDGSTWQFYVPFESLTLYDRDSGSIKVFGENKWGSLKPDAIPEVDDITIDVYPKFVPKSDGDDFSIDLNKYWLSGEATPISIPLRKTFYRSGALFVNKSDYSFMSDTDSGTITFPAGEYEFYSSVDFGNTGPALEDIGGIPKYFNKVGYENGLYRYKLTLTSDYDVYGMAFNDSSTYRKYGSIWLIDRFTDDVPDEITIKNIDKIIDADGVSIDGSGMLKSAGRNELVTRDYVDKTTGKADNVTLQQTTEDLALSTEADINLWFHNAWSEEFADYGWTLDSDSSFSNGELFIPAGTSTISGNYYPLTGPSDQSTSVAKIFHMVVSRPVTIFLEYYDGNNAHTTQISALTSQTLQDGRIHLSWYVPAGFPISRIHIQDGFSKALSIWLVDQSQYPPKFITKIMEIDHIIDDDGASVDESSTPMSDAHREIVTRAYIDSAIEENGTVDDITVERDIGFQIVTLENTFEAMVADAWDNQVSLSNVSAGPDITINSGLIHHAQSSTASNEFFTFNSDTQWQTGTHYIYSTIDLSSNTLYFEDDNGNTFTFDYVTQKDGLYIGRVNLSDFPYSYIKWQQSISEEYYVLFIKDDYIDLTENKIKNAEIINIINKHGCGINNNVPMFLPDHELTTRAYMENYVTDYVASVAHWTKRNSPAGIGQELKPADNEVKRVGLYSDTYGMNEFFIQNANNSDNYTGASITLTSSSTNYDSQMFISFYGPNFYLPHLASRGSIYTDSSMYIGAYNSTDKQGEPAFVSFVVGDDWNNQKEIFKLTTNGLEMPLTEKKFWYANGTQIQNHPTTYTQLFCNVDTSEVYAGVPVQLAPVRVITENNITLNGLQNIDGIDLEDGDRVAVFAQDNGVENGIYIAKDNSDWVRSNDMPAGISVGGVSFVVMEGSIANRDNVFIITNDKGNDVVGSDELTVRKLSVDALSSLTKVRLLESVFNIDLNNPPAQIDYTDVNDGDLICLTAQDNPVENGWYIVDSVNGWYRSPLLGEGISVAGILFVVTEGCINQDSLWLFTNDTGEDVVGTNNLYLRKVSDDGSLETREYFVIDSVQEANQYVQLSQTPLPNKHIIVSLNGLILTRGNGIDYDVSDDRIVFYNPIEQNDLVQVYYSYKAGSYCIPPEPPSPYFEFDFVAHNENEELNIYYIRLASDADNIEIDWGDGVTETYGTNLTNISHTYSDVGTKRVKILGHDWIRFTDGNISSDSDITVKNWGRQDRWQAFNGMFAKLTNIKIDVNSAQLNPTNPVSMEDMFRDCVNFNSANISEWVLTNVTSFKNMFNGCTIFNVDINGWQFPNATTISGMFANCHDFNQILNNWDTSNITDMSYTFYNTHAFNRDISSWDTSNVTNMDYMFAESDNFDQDISGWNVDNVTSCQYFRDNAALTCDHTPPLPSGCTGCFDTFKFNITVSSEQSLYFGNIQSKGEPGNDLVIDTGDGNVENLGQTYNNNYTHTYTAGGTYTVKIHGHKYIKFQGIDPSIPIEIIHWGNDNAWESLGAMFNSVNVTINADDIMEPPIVLNATNIFTNIPTDPDVSSMHIKVNSLYYAFADASSFTGRGLENWDVSAINTDNGSKRIFWGCSNFDGKSIENWDVSNWTALDTTFYGCTNFNPDVSNWRFTSVVWTYLTFAGCANWEGIGLDQIQWSTNLTNLRGTFSGCRSITDVDLSNWIVSNVTGFYGTFQGCTNFQGVGLENWDTSSATTFRSLFNSCTNFNRDISTWNTSNVTDMYGTFAHCTNFNQDLNGWDVSNVTTMYQMFYLCENFDGDLSQWRPSSCTDFSQMFQQCYVFTGKGGLGNWDMSSAQLLTSMFYRAGPFVGEDLGNWDVSNVTDMRDTFRQAYKFNPTDLSGWNTANVTTFNGTFRGASAFEGNGLENWNTSSNTTLYHTFEACVNLNVDLSAWDTSNVTNMDSTFANANSFNYPLNSWNTSKVTTMRRMFYGSNMTFNQDLDQWDVSNVTDFTSMFQYNPVFNGNISTWATSSATTMASMFQSASSFNQPIDQWDVSQVTNFSYMFASAASFNQNLNNWDTSSAIQTNAMFYNATAFNGDISTWSTSNVTNMQSMFKNANHFNRDLNSWNTSSVTDTSHMFENADSFNLSLNNWNTSNVTNMSYMFNNNDAFNQDISMWDVSDVQYCTNFRGGTSVLDCANTPALPNSCTGC